VRVWVQVLKGFGYVWLVLASALILFGTFGVFLKEGFAGVQQLYDPFNIVNFGAVIITLVPGLGALAWAEKLNAKLDGTCM